MSTWVKPNNNIPDNGRDEREFRQGDIWRVSDQEVSIPDSAITGRTVHRVRPVVIVSEYSDNCNPEYPMVLIAPICSLKPPITLKELSDVEVGADDGVLTDSLVRVGLIQPIMKVFLQKKLGELSIDALDRVLATLDMITGAELPELAKEDASYETAVGDDYEDSSFEY